MLPGVSNTLRRYDFSFKSGMTRVTGVAFIETPLSCSVNKVSVYRTGFSSPLPGRPVFEKKNKINLSSDFSFKNTTCAQLGMSLHQQTVHKRCFAMVQVTHKCHRPNQFSTVHEIGQEFHVVCCFWQIVLSSLLDLASNITNVNSPNCNVRKPETSSS